ncbi:CBO0543 family protein [Paenibacillus glycanilyticus]|uniref:CBO0543 family protein n=1 Tax=Paenibacillus glycanilyticus TaxID=126569 RepID=UPI0037CAB82B
MIFNIIVGFIIPWLCFVAARLPNKIKLALRVFPISSLIAFLLNDFFVKHGFWIVKPIVETNESYSAIPFNLGLYPVWGIFLIYVIERRIWSPIIFICIWSIGITCAEYVLVVMGRVIYDNGWHIAWTLISYIAAFSVVYLYCKFARFEIGISNNDSSSRS